eukprot:138872_1
MATLTSQHSSVNMTTRNRSNSQEPSATSHVDTLQTYTEKSTPCLTFVIVSSQLLMLVTSILSALYINDLVPLTDVNPLDVYGKSKKRSDAIFQLVLIQFVLYFIRGHAWVMRYRYNNETCCKRCTLYCQYYWFCKGTCKEEKCKRCGCAKFQRTSLYTRETVRNIICLIDMVFDLAAGAMIGYGLQSMDEIVTYYVSDTSLHLIAGPLMNNLFNIGTWLGCGEEFIEFSTELLVECGAGCLESCHPVFATCLGGLMALVQMIIACIYGSNASIILDQLDTEGIILDEAVHTEVIFDFEGKTQMTKDLYTSLILVSVPLGIWVFIMVIFLLTLKCRGR